jgi:uncharacterized membrane protein YhfC
MNILWVTHPISALLMILIPIGLGFVLTRRFQKSWGIWWVGTAAFVASQVGHIPFNIAVDVFFDRGWLPLPPPAWRLVFSAVFLGLSAGMWEGWFRYIAFRWWSKTTRSWQGGIVLGAGHGGIEAIILGALSLYTFANIIFLHGKDLATIFPAEQLSLVQQQISAYWGVSWFLPFLAPLERIFTLVMHIACSVLVLQAFTRGKIWWVWLAVFWHAFVDGFCVVYLPSIWSGYPWMMYAIEGAIGVCALISLGIIIILRQPEPHTQEPPLPPLQPIDLSSLSMSEETSERLDKTRFSG